MRPLPAQADCTQRRASAPRRRLYAANRIYHSANAAIAQRTSMTRRRPTASSLSRCCSDADGTSEVAASASQQSKPEGRFCQKRCGKSGKIRVRTTICAFSMLNVGTAEGACPLSTAALRPCGNNTELRSTDSRGRLSLHTDTMHFALDRISPWLG